MTKKKKDSKACDATIRIGGEAGQGMKVVSGILGKMFLRCGLHVFSNHDVMSRIRGGHNFSQIRISSESANVPAERVDILVCLDENTFNRYHGRVQGAVIYDPGQLDHDTGGEKKYLPLPMEEIAREKGGDTRMANSVASGAVLAVLGLPLDPLLDLLEEVFESKGNKIVKANQACAREGYERSRNDFQGETLCGRWKTQENTDKVLITGSEAMALGAITSDLRFFSAYPMSPATAIMEYLSANKKRDQLVVEQAEDEIAAVNMVIGAFFSGARSMTATSGGGLALMVEGISLAGMTETPLVIVDCQRPAPATGLPTRTEQADLLFVAHCGHGEFPRAILAPSSADEAFHLTRKAFYLAEKYQIPVFILGDQHLNDSSWTVKQFSLDDAFDGSRSLVPEKDLESISPYEYQRYEITESGISPRILPGTPHQVLYADSDEHTPEGHITESGEVRQQMVNKRLRKIEGLKKEISPPVIFPDHRAGIYLVSWGSTLGVVERAVHLLRDRGVDIGYIHFKEICPLKEDVFPFKIRKGARLIGVENNATGQLAKFLRMETGVAIEEAIRKYDGRPFSEGELVERIEQLMGDEDDEKR